ncbi:LCP family protein [Streptomyces sp. 7N604]|uniref:LCP family protein n=1 Tax=Streptomyces sp. 7N604 TaxID=3457415 RepID=UPI003FD45A12
MRDWPDGLTDRNRRGGDAEPTRAMGYDLRQGAHLPRQRSAPPPLLTPESSPGWPAAGHAPSGQVHPGIPHQVGTGGPWGNDDAYDSYDSYGPGAEGPEAEDDHGGRRRGRRIMRTLIVLVLVILVTSIGTYVWADFKLDREVDLAKVGDRSPSGEGTNYLIVGSDSREGLSNQDKNDLHTGSAEGRRTDSMIVLHTGDNGTTMMSLPRDSWVTIPAFTRPETGKHYAAAKNKLNAAFSMGGPELLVRTVEANTGLKINHYAEIGFAGFVNIVDSVGGVDLCLDKDIKDEKSGADLRKGCQTLSGADALAFVRQRHQEAEGDLGRTRNQQKFLSALADQAATPGTVLNPSKLYPAMGAGLETLIVDRDMSLSKLTSMLQAMKAVTGGDGKQINVPVADQGFQTSKGSAVRWDTTQAKKLFDELKNDQPVSLGEKK